MQAEKIISQALQEAVQALYGVSIDSSLLQIQPTRKDFEGDLTAVMFPLLKISRKGPEPTGAEIAEWLCAHVPEIERYNVIKGFLNLKLSALFWKGQMADMIQKQGDYAPVPDSGKTVVIEYSSPNTNKPLHLGHVRNNLLGWAVANILAANGDHVVKVNLVNDRGIHICKSMLAWQQFGQGRTPASTGQKGDHLVGDYYVRFDKEYKAQINALVADGMDPDVAAKEAPIMKEAQTMLRQWEQGDPQVIGLWKTMNQWVYDGFDRTYKQLGVGFDTIYYESQTYLLGKELVQKGLDTGVFFRKEDGSVWCDLTPDGLDMKLLLRSDGTSVYMTQDLGTAVRRFEAFGFDRHIYVVGNEQNYHFQVLKCVLQKLGYPWAERIVHLSYGMVELPEGKMKSREGTVVDADELMEGMIETARETSTELGKLEDMDASEQQALFEMLGLGALKYFILKVDPRKTMLFDPKESIDFNGNTGPFIQYTHARIKSVLRKAAQGGVHPASPDQVASPNVPMLDKEIRLVKIMASYPQVLADAATSYAPSMLANFAFELAKEFNQYYHEVSVLREPNEDAKVLRLSLLQQIADLLKQAMNLLGISLPERM